MIRVLTAAALLAGGAVAGYLWRDANPPPGNAAGASAIEQNVPGPGDPPVVWLTGTLAEIGRDEMVLEQGDGPRLHLQRFAAGATRFHTMEGGVWRVLSRPEADAAVGEAACIETLMDGDSLLAVRVYLDAACAPRP